MTDSNPRAKLIPIWEQHRSRLLSYGQALHALLPEGGPPITLHGRDLRPEEGVGFQFQCTLTDNLYGGDVTAACFAVQLELIVRKTSIGVKVDAAPLLEYRDGHYEVFSRRQKILPFGDDHGLRQFFGGPLTHYATRVFVSVRAGKPLDEVIAGIAEPAPTI